MNGFDAAIIGYVNDFAHRSWLFDTTVAMLGDNDFLKGGVVIAGLWALWFASSGEEVHSEDRKTILAALAGSMASIFIVRFLAWALPFRMRPKFNPELGFLIPLSVDTGMMNDLSAFPSDHAAMFTALVTGIFLVSRRFGLFAFVYVFVMVLFPRVYLGLHHPTDIIGGCILGAGVVLLVDRSGFKERTTLPLLEWSRKYPAWFYGLFFLGSYEMCELYIHVRQFGEFAMKVSLAMLKRFS